MSAAEKIQQEIQPNMVADRLAEAEGMLKDEKVRLPDEVLEAVVKGIKNISEKLEKRLPVYESDFDFMEELERFVKLGSQYGEAMASLKECGLYNPEDANPKDEKPPTREEVIQIMGSKLTKEQKEAIRRMKEPVLQIVPIKTMTNYLTVLDNNTPIFGKTGKRLANIWPSTEAMFERIDEECKAKKRMVSGWKISIIEGSDLPNLLNGENERTTLRERMEWFDENYVKKGIDGIGFKNWILLQILKFSKKPPEPIDNGMATIINGDVMNNGFVSTTLWNNPNRTIFMRDENTDNILKSVGFRPTVNIKISKPWYSKWIKKK